MADVRLLSAIEADLGIVSACLIVLRPFFRRHLPSLVNSQKRSSSYKPGSSRLQPGTPQKWSGSGLRPSAGFSGIGSMGDSRFRHEEYLELGEGGTTSTSAARVQHKDHRREEPTDDLGGNDGGGIIKTVGVDVYETPRLKPGGTSGDLPTTATRSPHAP